MDKFYIKLSNALLIVQRRIKGYTSHPLIKPIENKQSDYFHALLLKSFFQKSPPSEG